jgi:hypothetical protein
MRFRRLVERMSAVVLALAVLHACRDGTAPDAGVQIALHADVGNPTIDTSTNVAASIACSVRLTATPSGSGSASWLGGTIEFFAGRDRSHPLASDELAAADVSQLFDGAPINGGTTVVGSFDISAGIPFSAHLTLRYRSSKNAADRAASVDIACGAVPSGAGPTISSLTVTPVSGNLDIGDSLKVSYSATSPGGLWHATLLVPLPCGDFSEQFNDGGRTVVDRTVYVRLPSLCPLGQHITSAQLTVSDAGLLTAARAAAFDLTISDTRPPKISLDSLSGDFFVGDTIHYDWWVTDNGFIRTIGWEIPGTSTGESMDASRTTGSLRVSVPLKPEWAPSFQLRLFAEDAAGNRSEMTSPPGGMRLHPTVQRTINSLALADQYGDFVLDERRGIAYLLGAYSPKIAVISLSPLGIIGSVTLPQIGTSFDLTSSGDTLLVTLNQSRSLAIVDLTKPERPVSQREISILNAAVGEQAVIVRTTATGHAIVNTWVGEYQAAAPFVDLDPATWDAKRLDFGGRTDAPIVLAERSGDRRVFVLRNTLVGAPMTFTRYDATTGIVGASHTVLSPPIGALSLDYTGQHVAIGYDVYDASFNRISHSPRLTGDFTIISSDGSTLWQSGLASPFVRTRVADGAVLDRSSGTDLGRTRFNSDGSMLITLYPTMLTFVDAR